MTQPQATSNGLIATRIHRPLRAHSEEGGALVELSVTLPIIFLIMTGIFAFSIGLYQKLALAEGISSGGRFLAADRGDLDPCEATAAVVYGAAPTLNQSSFTFSFTLNGVTTSGASCPGSGGLANANMVQGKTATISATYPCAINIYNFNFFSSCNLGYQVSEQIQ